MKRGHRAWGIVGLVLMAACLRGQAGGLSLGGTPAASRVKTEIVAESAGLAEGKPVMVAVTLSTNREWHIYWSNPGDAGYATTFKWTVPQGWKVEPLAFPIPEAFVQPGDIHVLGYEGKTTFLFRIVPEGAGKGAADGGKFSVIADWLCCNKEQCVPGKATLELPVAAADGGGGAAGEAANKELFAEAMEHIPAAAPPAGVVVGAPVATSDAPEKWRVELGWAKTPPSVVEAFPPAVEGLDMSVAAMSKGDLKELSTGGSSVIEFKAHVFSGQKVQAQKIPLLIAYTAEDGKRKGFFVDLDAAAIGVRPK